MQRYRRIGGGCGYEVGVWRCGAMEPGPHEPELASGYAMIFPVAGAFTREVEGKRDLADSTRVVFENAGEWYRAGHPVAGGAECTVLTLSATLTESLAPLSGGHGTGDTVFLRQTAPSDPMLYALHRRLAVNFGSAARDPIALDELAYCVMGRAMAAANGGSARATPKRAKRHRQIALARALEYLHASFRETLTLDRIARHVGYSPFHLTRLFRAETGLPIHRYVTQLRLCSSFEAVIGGERDLTRVAHAHGFSSHSHFTQAFHRAFGAPPSRIRQRWPA